MTDKEKPITEIEMIDSLTRSGFLLESEITNLLVEYGFFVESNTVSIDPFTGKSREIDLLAEYDHPFTSNKSIDDKTVAFARFVFEIKNNNIPVVLLTKHVYSPHTDIYEGLKEYITIPHDMPGLYSDGFYGELFLTNKKKNLFTQYCSFTRKNKDGELMAHHPDVLYSALQKITHFCEENTGEKEYSNTYKNEYYRKFVYLPIILLKDDLYELEIEHTNTVLKKVDQSYLVFNYHYEKERRTSIVHFVTKAGLKDFLEEILEAEKNVQAEMILDRKTYRAKI